MNYLLQYLWTSCFKILFSILRRICFFILLSVMPTVSFGQSPDDATFGLRDYYGDETTDFTTSVRNQSWGTCWIHGTYAAMESNLSMTGNWTAAGMESEADLAEYHIDKFIGFNRKGEPDDEPNDGWYTGQKDPFPGSNYDEFLGTRTHGLIVHLGGDYRIATAYLINHGAVNETDLTTVSGYYPEKRIDFGYGDYDGIPKTADDFHYFIAHGVEWHTLYGNDTEKRQRIKKAIVDYGAVATCMYYGANFYSGGIHYQPPEDTREPNHAIAIVGWDDYKETQAEQDGAWLCKNSWGAGWNGDGYFWISYYDKHAARHPQMGGVTFRGVQQKTFDHIYSHSLHGWQYDTAADTINITQAANRLVALQDEQLIAVGIFTMAEDVAYTVHIYDILGDENTLIAQKSGTIKRAGFHLIDLDGAAEMQEGEDYFIALELDRGGYAFDASFRVYTAMGIMPDIQPKPGPYDDVYKFDQSYDIYAAMGTITDPPYDVYSKANPGESFYKDASGMWLDFRDYDAYNLLQTEWNDTSWNFAINGYTIIIADFCEGNFDGDDDVDDADLAVFAVFFGRSDCGSNPSCEGAFASDADVDGADLAVFVTDFGRTDCN